MDMLSGLMIIFSIAFLIIIIKLVNTAKVTLEYSLLWLFIGLIMLVFSVFPFLPTFFSNLFGFETMSNFILVMALLFCLLQLLVFTKYITKQSKDITKLIQEISILKEILEEKDEKTNK